MIVLRIVSLASLLALFAGCGDRKSPVAKSSPTPVPEAEMLGRNLLVNGDAEAIVKSEVKGETDVAATWSRSPDVLAAEYGSIQEEWQATKPGCPDGRKRYFRLALAINEDTKEISQTIPLAGLEKDIDGGHLECAIGGWFGGWIAGDASARLEVDFLNAKEAKLGSLTSDAPDPMALPKPESGRASMITRIATGAVPTNTRMIAARLIALRPTKKLDSNAVAAADNLSVVLRKKQ